MSFYQCTQAGTYLNCLENPEMENWPGVGSWEVIPESFNVEDTCSPAYGPNYVKSQPNICERKGASLSQSVMTTCPSSEGSNHWQTYLYNDNYCSGQATPLSQQLLTSCNEISKSNTKVSEFAQCTVLTIPGVVNLPTSNLAHIGGSEDAKLIIAGIAGIILLVLFVLSSIAGLIYYYFAVYVQNTGVDEFLQGKG